MNITPSLAISVEIGYAIAMIVVCFKLAGYVGRMHHWKGEHIKEIGAEIGWASFWGVILSWAFAFHGSDPLLTTLGCIGFMTFFYPFLALGWITDWPGERFRIKDHGKAALVGLGAIETTVLVLSLTAYVARLNAGYADALVFAGGTFIVGSAIILLLGLFAEALVVRA